MPRETLRISPAGWALLSLSLTLFCAGASAAVVTAATNLARRLAPLENLSDVYTQSFIMMAAYIAQYLVLGSVFEGTHPAGALSSSLAVPALSRRRVQVGHEITAGILSLAITVALAVLWMYAGEPRSPFFAYFVTHEWTPVWGVVGLVAYVACFDTWCGGRVACASQYATCSCPSLAGFISRTLRCTRLTGCGTTSTTSTTSTRSHLRLRNLRYTRLRRHCKARWGTSSCNCCVLCTPSNLRSWASSPLHGHSRHMMAGAWTSITTCVSRVCEGVGFMVSARVRVGTLSHTPPPPSQTYHHSKGRGRKHYFNLGFLTPFWDVVMGTRWTEDHPLWVQWKKDGAVYDTRDGTPGGVSNDAFGAYVEGRQPPPARRRAYGSSCQIVLV